MHVFSSKLNNLSTADSFTHNQQRRPLNIMKCKDRAFSRRIREKRVKCSLIYLNSLVYFKYCSDIYANI
jgi:hypothetical protein